MNMNLVIKEGKTNWVSLFDLYFPHTSPVPYKHTFYNEFFVKLGFLIPKTRKIISDPYYGFVTLNLKGLKDSKYYVKKKEKNIFYMEPFSQEDERFYDLIWNTYYNRGGLGKYMEKIFEQGKFFPDRKRDLTLISTGNMSTDGNYI